MPFTPAHAAAAWPFQRTRLVMSALVVGTFAPDFEYFIRLSPGGGFGHSILGAFVLALPLALAVLWIFHAIVKVPLVALFPTSVQRRLVPHLGRFRFFGPARFALIVLSVLVGIATHLLWDSFTHSRSWLYHHWWFLHELSPVHIFGPTQYYKLFQYASSVIGIVILVVWIRRWYRSTPPSATVPGTPLSGAQKVAVVSFGVLLATVGAMVRVLPNAALETGPMPWKKFAGYAIATWIALAWWALVAYGLLVSRRAAKNTTAATKVG
jgi:hypothetical protein